MTHEYISMFLPLEFIDKVEQRGDAMNFDKMDTDADLWLACFKEIYDHIKQIREIRDE